MDDKKQDETGAPAGCAVRLLWMAAGPFALVVCIFGIARAPTVSHYDGLLWLVVAGMIGARYLDVSRFAGMTVNAEPASMGHVKRYAGTLLALCLALWGVAHALEL